MISLWNSLRHRHVSIPTTPEGLRQLEAELSKSRLELLRHMLLVVADLDTETLREMEIMLGVSGTSTKQETYRKQLREYIQ